MNVKTKQRECEVCHTIFEAPLKEINRGNGRFCSLSCSSSRKKDLQPNVQCAYCDKYFYKNPSKQQLSKSGLFFCCREHKDLAQRIGGIKEIQPPHYGEGYRSNYRLRAFNHLPNKCNRCELDDMRILVVHHIDRDRSNNNINNLEILCPNCHALEHRS